MASCRLPGRGFQVKKQALPSLGYPGAFLLRASAPLPACMIPHAPLPRTPRLSCFSL